MKQESVCERLLEEEEEEGRELVLTQSTQSQEDDPSQNQSFHLDFCALSLNCENYLPDFSSSSVKRKEKLSLVLNQIAQVATRRSIPNEFDEGDSINHHSQGRRKSSIVSVYCKKSDITFVSSPEDFTLQLMISHDNDGEHCDFEHPDLSELHLQMIYSEKEVNENPNHVFEENPNLKNVLSLSPEGDVPNKSYNINSNRIHHSEQETNVRNSQQLNDNSQGEEDESSDYDILLSNSSDSILQNAISRHSALLKSFERVSKLNPSTGTQSAYDLMLSLTNNIQHQ